MTQLAAEGSADVDPQPPQPAVDGASPRRLARTAGLLYLVNVVAGAFAIGYVQSRLLSPDPVVTAANLQAHELLYRAGLAAHVLVTVTNVPLALIFYELLKHVNRRLALLDAFFILVATAIEAAGIVAQSAPLLLLGDGAGSSGAPPAELRALAALTGAFADVDYTVYTVFFGIDIVLMSYLLLRSRLVPRALALLLAVDGVAYLLYSGTAILAPGLATGLVPWIQLPAPVAEGGLSLWLLVVGVGGARKLARRPGAAPDALSPPSRSADGPGGRR